MSVPKHHHPKFNIWARRKLKFFSAFLQFASLEKIISLGPQESRLDNEFLKRILLRQQICINITRGLGVGLTRSAQKRLIISRVCLGQVLTLK